MTFWIMVQILVQVYLFRRLLQGVLVKFFFAGQSWWPTFTQPPPTTHHPLHTHTHTQARMHTLKGFLRSCLKWLHSSWHEKWNGLGVPDGKVHIITHALSCCSRKWPHKNFIMWFSFLISSTHWCAWSTSYCYYLFNLLFMDFLRCSGLLHCYL